MDWIPCPTCGRLMHPNAITCGNYCDAVLCTQIIEAFGREVGRIWKVWKNGQYHGSFFTQTKWVRMPVSKVGAYGINYNYLANRS